ncbi:hypothetical protein [Bradyrhizobium sp. DASA03007]|uniref:hypothetical protein n=1 Tax=unclassified Bradyrhizobium TaxID=2631580 RepID=UPI003F700C99
MTRAFERGLSQFRKNYIINGAMMLSQENGTTVGTANGYFPVDQFYAAFSNSGTISMAQVASATPAGSPNRLRVTVTAADASVASGDFLNITQPVEGLRIADLKSGSATPKTVVLQFGVKAPAGTYCVAFRNGAPNRSYVGEYTISAGEANTDVVKTINLTLDNTGTWAIDNTAGVYLSWSLMAGSTYQTPAGVWTAGNFLASANQFNFMGTNGNVFELFDVGLYEGTTAPAFQVPDPVIELLLCQRYFCSDFAINTPPADNIQTQKFFGSAVNSAGLASQKLKFPVTMRAAPTMTFYASNVKASPVAGQWQWFNGSAYVDGSGISTFMVGADGFGASFSTSTVTTNNSYLVAGSWKANARM